MDSASGLGLAPIPFMFNERNGFDQTVRRLRFRALKVNQVQALEARATDAEAASDGLHIFIEGDQDSIVGFGCATNDYIGRTGLQDRRKGNEFIAM